jgi:Family of unknown function (DUF6527)
VKRTAITAQNVECIPEVLDDGVLYISERFKTAMHLCCCGCRGEVVTPFSPAEWRLAKHGTTVSLSPSIGNWSFACQSHYWITRNKVEWDVAMSRSQIERVRKRDRVDKERYITVVNAKKVVSTPSSASIEADGPERGHIGFFGRLWKALARGSEER